MNMNKKIIALGVSALSAAALAFGTASPAMAVDPVPAVDTICGALPTAATDLIQEALDAVAALTAADTDLDVAQAAMAGSITGLVTASVSFLETVDAGGNTTLAAAVLNAATDIFADKFAIADEAGSAWYSAQRDQVLTGMTQGYIAQLQAGLGCAPVVI
ncbi:MAG: hypothetical protein QOE93_739 [Actinomycetota bacterium]|jgi:hypothetical protein|nr:hypothetical protein [Actinomycetota bacterium]